MGYSSPSRLSEEEIDKKTEELAKRYKVERKKPAKQILNDDKIIIDLHADELLETTVGMTSADILEYQIWMFSVVHSTSIRGSVVRNSSYSWQGRRCFAPCHHP